MALKTILKVMNCRKQSAKSLLCGARLKNFESSGASSWFLRIRKSTRKSRFSRIFAMIHKK
jgi:hypothetical protein